MQEFGDVVLLPEKVLYVKYALKAKKVLPGCRLKQAEARPVTGRSRFSGK